MTFFHFRFIPRFYLPILLCFFFSTPALTAPENEVQALPEEMPANATPKQQIDAIALRRKTLEDKRKEKTERLSKASGGERADLREQVELLDQIDAVLAAQIGEWQRHQEIDGQKSADLAEASRLDADAKNQITFSVFDLDHVREQLKVASTRSTVVRAKFDAAKQALSDAQRALKQLPEAKSSGIAADSVALQREFAEQQKVLRELELNNEENAYSAHEALLQLLQKRIDLMQHHAVFDDQSLKERLADINRLEFETNRDLEKLKDQKLKAQSLVDRSRRRLEEVSLEDDSAAEEFETRRLELDAVDAKIDEAQSRSALLTQRKKVWKQRFDVLNDRVDQQTLPQWRKQAEDDIEQIQQNQSTLKLWLTDWQSRLDAVTSKLAYTTGTVASWQGRQQNRIQDIIETLTESDTDLESNRSLLNHFVDDINVRSAQRSLFDWLVLVMHLEIQHDSLLVWTYAFTIAMITFGLLFLLRWFLMRTLRLAAERKHFSHAEELLTTVKRANLLFFLAVALYCASLPLTLAPSTEMALGKFIKIVIAIQAAIWISGFLRAWIFRILAHKTKGDGASMGALSIVNFTGQVVLWSIAALLIMQNLGVDITALVAGLGIGGIAVALALQRILSDLLSSLSIVLDKPFMVGDFIILGDYLGSVEHIGIKTTRLRSLSGEQIICSNSELLEARIRNFKRMEERRVVFTLGVIYQTTYEQLQKIPAMLKTIIETTENTRFDRAHFFKYGDFSLDFEIVYYILSPDYNIYMDAQQAINLEIYRQFRQVGIEFAYPTQSIFVSKDASA